jgi:FMN phosphatase YigB (HAD superfamily)
MKTPTRAILIDFNRTIFDPNTNQLYPNALKILKYLAQSYDLYLISKMELDRIEKLEALGIKHLFKKTYFVKEKTEELFEEILHAYNKEYSYVIGDVVTNEISIGIKIKTNTIWVRQGKFKDIELPSWHEKPTHIIEELEEIKNIIVS